MEDVHYFQIFRRIVLKGGLMTQTEDVAILCGAKKGTAVDTKKRVTCEKCRDILRKRAR
jgi:hypothetical protein